MRRKNHKEEIDKALRDFVRVSVLKQYQAHLGEMIGASPRSWLWNMDPMRKIHTMTLKKLDGIYMVPVSELADDVDRAILYYRSEAIRINQLYNRITSESITTNSSERV